MKSKFLLLAIAAMMMGGANAANLDLRRLPLVLRSQNLNDFRLGAQNFAVPQAGVPINIIGVTFDNSGVLIIDPNQYRPGTNLTRIRVDGERIGFDKINAIYIDGDINTAISDVRLFAIMEDLPLIAMKRVIGRSIHGGFVAVALPGLDEVFRNPL